MASPFPETPSRYKSVPGRDGPSAVIQQLNAEYNLGIPEPDETLTPSHKNQLPPDDQRCDSIRNKIRFLFFQDSPTLEETLDRFQKQAHVIQPTWTKRTRGDGSRLSFSRQHLKVATCPEQQHELQVILLNLLREVTPSKPFPARPDQPTASCTGSAKRGRDDELEDLFAKRTKPEAVSLTPRVDDSDVSLVQLPSRRVLFRRTSTNTSSESLSSGVFSAAPQDDDSWLSYSQTTVDITAQENEKGLPTQGGRSRAHSRSSSHLHGGNEPLSWHGIATSSSMGSSMYRTLPQFADLLAQEKERLRQKENKVYEADYQPKILGKQLEDIWPIFPRWLRNAPFAAAWEITRIALHCGIDLGQAEIAYNSEWGSIDQDKLRAALYKHDAFRGKTFPEPSDPHAWRTALGHDEEHRQVVFVASLSDNKSNKDKLYTLKLLPLTLDRPTRLGRRFGGDRFLELILPSPGSSAALRDENAWHDLISWLALAKHSLAGRNWRAFYVKENGYKKAVSDVHLGPEPKMVSQNRVYLFCETGHGFRADERGGLPQKGEPIQARTRASVQSMLDWLLQVDRNTHQPSLKLFSRIALGLSRISPAVTLEVHQLRHRDKDIVSPNGNAMNDGIGRMSRSVARKIRESLGLLYLPSAVQARLGSAKGMWIVDVNDTGDEDWVETYPSQRKWECDFQDECHRTLEVRSTASELRSARLNLQFLPVLEDRARDKSHMRSVIGNVLKEALQKDIDSQQRALQDPRMLLQWTSENSAFRHERLLRQEVPFLGGLPSRDEETLNFLAVAGFDAKHQRLMLDIAWKLQLQKCEKLKEKLNIPVARSAYIYMVVDFLGVLEEGEVHLGFSSRFGEGDYCEILLHGSDVLVARSPAHYVSDMQRVKAVFKPELRDLKDVIVFSTKGNVALADKLSGGDYDGDLAWVCWEPDIVNNFVNAPIPTVPDLFALNCLRKRDETFGKLVQSHGDEGAIRQLIQTSFVFNMGDRLLGRCTNYKERLCYKHGNVNDEAAVFLSTLLSFLVDQSKQGIEFTTKDWNMILAKILKEPPTLRDPAYKSTNWTGDPPTHIIDYLKFEVAKPLINAELQRFSQVLHPSKAKGKEKMSQTSSMIDAVFATDAGYLDKDLTAEYQHFLKLSQESESYTALLQALMTSIDEVKKLWDSKVTVRKNENSFPQVVLMVYEKWLAIVPDLDCHEGLRDSQLVALLTQSHLKDPETSQWALLKASTAFQKYYNKGRFVWQMAGRQLQFMKARMKGGPITAMTPSMYACFRPDNKYIKQVVAFDEGHSSYFGDDDDDGHGFIEDDT